MIPLNDKNSLRNTNTGYLKDLKWRKLKKFNNKDIYNIYQANGLNKKTVAILKLSKIVIRKYCT